MIQLSLEFQLEKPQLPLEYERLMVSFLKAASRNYSEDMFERLYNKEHSVHICQVRYLKVTLYFLGTTDLKFFLQMLIWDRL